MNSFKKIAFIILPIIGFFSLSLLYPHDQGSFLPIGGDETSFSIQLNATNAPSLSTSTFENGISHVRYTDFDYENARNKAGYHVELNTNGVLMNALDSQITSITNITVNFASTGTLSLATSYDGIEYTSTLISSGVNNATSSAPYFFKLVANDALVQITSVVIDYSCVPHSGPAPVEVTYSLAVKSYNSDNTATDFSQTINTNKANYFTTSSNLSLSNVSGSKLFSMNTGANNGIKFASSDTGGSLTLTFAQAIEFSAIRISLSKYGSDSATVKVTSNQNTSGITVSSLSSSMTEYSRDFPQNNAATTLTIASNASSKQRFHFYGITLVGIAAVTPIETGISASDAMASNYRTTDVYSTNNQLAVQLLKSSGSPTTLTYDPTGTSGYRYTLKNSLNTVVDATQAFTNAGTYTVTVTYKSFVAPVITLTVTEVVITPVVLISVSAVESKTDYKVGDIYLNAKQLVVTSHYDDQTSNIISYDATGETGYTIYMLDPNADDFYPSNPFSVVGDYIFTVTYEGVESNDITIHVGENNLTSASINIGLVTENDSTSVVSKLGTYVTSQDLAISSVTGATIFGGANYNRLRFTSNSAAGSIVINFSNSTIIQGVTLSVGDYNGKSSSVKVATSANTTGQNLTVTTGVSSLSYTAFSSNTTASTSLTISSASGNQFYLYGITLTLGSSTPVAATGVNVTPNTLSLGQGTTGQLTASVLPNNATNKAVTWSTSDAGIATVNQGVVTAVAIGSATITVTTIDGAFSATSVITVTAMAMNEYYVPSMVDSNFDLQDLQKAGELNAIPSKGQNINILVVPVEFTGYSFTTKTLTDLEILFNGTEAQTNYWESVSSFYQESSFGNLNMSFTVAPKYVTGLSPTQAAALDTTSTQYFSTNLLRSAVSNYKTNNGTASTKNFDSDSDGYIDAVWLIYSCPNYSNSTTIRNISTDYWAYVFWDYTQTPSTSSPNPNVYGWASYDFMYEGGGTTKVDGHTYIHETGHLLGLDDYYNYDDNSTYKPMGGIDMMDYNVIDHNAWTKMALGWQKPYVVTGNAEITLSPSQMSGQSILIADSWNGTSYDEFLMLELYTPTGLNALDSSTAYSGSYPRGYTTSGVRLMHIDSRIGKQTYSSSNGWYFNGYFEPTSLTLSGNNYYAVAHSNTPSYSADPEYRLIHMIQATGTNTFKTGSVGSNADLFTTGKSFSMATYGTAFFKNGNKLNNNNSLNYRIEFTSVSATSATIKIYKL